MKTIAEQITALEAKRAASASRMEAVMQKSLDEDRTSDAAEQDEFDKLDARSRRSTRTWCGCARSRGQGVRGQAGASRPAPRRRACVRSRVETAQPKLPPGIAFAQLGDRKGRSRSRRWCRHPRSPRQRWPDHADIEFALKAAVAPGSSYHAGNAGATEHGMAAELIWNTSWHRTIVGASDRRACAGCRSTSRCRGRPSVASVSWVGEAAPKPLLGVRARYRDARLLQDRRHRRADRRNHQIFQSRRPRRWCATNWRNAIVTLMDHDFIDPEKAAVAGISPASITNGVTPTTATGTAYANFAADLGTTLAKFDAARIDTASLAIVMSRGSPVRSA